MSDHVFKIKKHCNLIVEKCYYLESTVKARNSYRFKVQKKDSFFRIFQSLFDSYARWKGTGEPWPKFTLKIDKNFPLQI